MTAKKHMIFLVVGLLVLGGLLLGALYLVTPNNDKVTVNGSEMSATSAAVSSDKTVATSKPSTESAVAVTTPTPAPKNESSDVTTEKKDKKTEKKSSKKNSEKKSDADTQKDSSEKKAAEKKNGSKKDSSKKNTSKKNASKKKTSKKDKTGDKKEKEQVETVKLQNLTVTTKDGSYKVSGKTLTISKAGTYELSGSATDGQILVEAAKTDVITLVLKGVTVTNTNSSPLYIKSADEVDIQLASGTKNTFTDGAKYTFATGATEPDGAIFSQEDLTIEGSGSLTVNAKYLDGVVSKNDLKIKGGTVSVNAKDDGLRGKDSVQISGGKVTVISTEAHGIKTTEEADSAKGFVEISGGDVTVDAEKDGIHSTNYIEVTGGKVYVDAKNEGIDTDSTFTITGGNMIVDGPKSENHASMDCGKGYFLNGGTFLAVGSATLIKAPASGSKKKFIFYNLPAEQTTETTVKIVNSDNKKLIEHTTTRKYQNVIFSAPELPSGTYYIYANAVYAKYNLS